MAKNRKNLSTATRFGPAIGAALCCTILAFAGMNYVYQKNQIFELGRQISAREARLKELRVDNERVMNRLESLISPKSLEIRVRDMNLGLRAPREDQIMRLLENSGTVGQLHDAVELAQGR